MTNAGYIISNVIGGMIAGAIGAGVSQDADHPILKGAIVTGLVTGALGAVLIATTPEPKQVGTGDWRPHGAFS